MDIYDKISLLLQDNGISAYKLAKDTGLSTGLLSQWKSRKQNPSTDKIAKIAEYFNVPVDYLLGRPPFDHWEQIYYDKGGFLYFFLQNWSKPVETLDLTWGINVDFPNLSKLTNFIHFIDATVCSATVSEQGEWVIELKDNVKKELAAYPGFVFSDAESQLIHLFRMVPTDKQEQILEVVKSILKLAGLLEIKP